MEYFKNAGREIGTKLMSMIFSNIADVLPADKETASGL